jgi:hypothetical protein
MEQARKLEELEKATDQIEKRLDVIAPETKTEPTKAVAKVEEAKPGWFRRALSYWPCAVGGVIVFAAGVATHSYFTAPADELE